MANHIKTFSEVGIKDVASVEGKNSSLGEMFTQLSDKGIKVPDGFALTASAFSYFLECNNLKKLLQELMQQLDKQNYSNLNEIGSKARQLILTAQMPFDLKELRILKEQKN